MASNYPYRYAIQPTSLLSKRKDQRGRYFSLTPCDICGAEGIKFEVTRYTTGKASHLGWLLSFEGHPEETDDFEAPTPLAHKRYTCSEECANIYILSGEHKSTGF